MTPERWEQVREVLHGALQLAPEQRAAFLDRVCPADDLLRRDVESLLSSNEASSSFLKSSALRITISKGTRLGDYEVQSLLGSGGMGEVYRARDLRLNRDVAIKMLPAFLSSDPDRLRRFEQEARATAALNHPNILAVHQLGTHEGAPYLVSELLEGLTLREQARRGLLPIRKTIDYAIQIAHGLAAAHDKGIVHRDLKPENLFVTKDGRIKILDFGLAKLTQPKTESNAATRTIEQRTEPGMVMGTVGYMAPEQVRGEVADHRSDIFSFGAILYEMLSGKQAFVRPTAADTISAILKDDPPSLSENEPPSPIALQRIVYRCLEKSASERFHSAWDLGFALEGLSTSSDSALALTGGKVKSKRPKGVMISTAVAALALVAATALLVGRHFAPTTPIRFEDVVLRRGQFWQARFAPDRRTVVYGAVFRFGEDGLYVADANTQVGRSLGIPDAGLLAVSQNGELAVLLSPHQIFQYSGNSIVGTLARVPLSGGTPRAVLENVQSADWSPDGSQLAVSRYSPEQKHYLLEYPLGHVLYETSGYISDVRVAPDGNLVAFMDHPEVGDTIGAVAVVDRAGNRKTISPQSWPKSWGEDGLAWSPSGKEVWITNQGGLWAIALSGTARPLLQIANALSLRDIAPDGTLLLYQQASNGTSMILHKWSKPATERDLSWLDAPFVTDISEDGELVLFNEQGFGGGPEYTSFIRKTDGSPAIQLGPGRSTTISPDKHWAITTGFKKPKQLFLVPLEVGEPRQLTEDAIDHHFAFWMPNSTEILFVGEEPGHGFRVYQQDIHRGSPKALTPEGCALAGSNVSFDGKLVLLQCSGAWMLLRIGPGTLEKVQGIQPNERVLRWTRDGGLWVFNTGAMNLGHVISVDPNTGSRKPWKEIQVDSFSGISYGVITADGNTFVDTEYASSGSLRRVYGLR
jgi:serine/threonine protein kinase